MRGHALTAQAHAPDPLQSAGNVVDSAVVAVSQGTYDAQERISGAMPAIGHFVSRMVYTSCYGLSYGVVFPVLLVVRMVPKNNAIVHGLVNGAIAAREQVEDWGPSTTEDDLHEVDESENGDGEAEIDSPTEAPTNHRHRSTRRGRSAKATRSARKR